MDQCRLTSLSEVAEEEFLFKLFETPCFPRCDLTTITGPAKSGKTYVVSMLMACCVKRQVLAFERIREEPLKVVWLDTEQSRMTTKRILTERIGKMTGDTDGFPDEQFYALNVRGQTPEERVDMLTLAIKTYEPDMVVIDGIADLMGDINSGPDSTKLIQQLLGMATEHKCNITAIIHLNRTGERLNLRGWIGTVMVQKSYEVLNCDKVSKTQTFSADLTFSRRFHQKQTFYYTNQALQYQNGFNSGIWSQLEQDVSSCRNGLKSNQRLFVVVGVLYEDSQTTGGVPVPSHFYKCLMLCTFNGSTMTAASGCAYLFTNEAHTGSYSAGVTSIDAVEARAGFDFFAAVPASLQAAAESGSSELW